MDKKIVMCFGIVIIVALVSILFLMINYNLENKEDYVQSYCQSWADKNKIITPACVGHWERNQGCKWVCDSSVSECSDVLKENVQDCCDNWAMENNIAKIMCAGSWVINNGSCEWECFNTSESKEGFCGWSTNASCGTDLDCVMGGCSGQVCSGKNEEVITTCEFKDCYDNEKFGIECGCVEGICTWAKL